MRRFNRAEYVFFLLLIPLIGVSEYFLMSALNPYVIQVSGKDNSLTIIYMVLILTVGLIAPYLMLKALFHAAHIRDGKEKELALKDLSKDQEKLNVP